MVNVAIIVGDVRSLHQKEEIIEFINRIKNNIIENKGTSSFFTKGEERM